MKSYIRPGVLKRLAVVLVFVLVVAGVLELFAYDVIKIDWVSFMEIQPSFRPMEKPLPIPADSIPIEGPVTLAAYGANNPVKADAASLSRGEELFRLNCRMCHGDKGKGDGSISVYIKNKPADLTSLKVQSLTDAGIFLTITNGVPGKMPALNENFTVRERWDIVNYVRTLK